MALHHPKLQKVVDQTLAERNGVRILEAGCGSMSFFDFKTKTTIVGIDISQKQLDLNMILDEKINGDIMIHKFPPDSFDVIICVDVLEHLDRPQLALDNFRSCIAEGGIIILKLPNLLSIKGLVTKFSPHWIHVWFYKKIYGYKDVGKQDRPPFKTFLENCVSPPALKQWAEKKGLTVLFEDFYEAEIQQRIRKKNSLTFFLWKPLTWFITILSLGKISLKNTEYILVAQNSCKKNN